MDSIATIKTKYEEMIAKYSKIVGKDISEECNRIFLAGIFRIWGSNDMLYSPSYQETLRELTGKTYTPEQIITAMACCSDPKRKLKIPWFIGRTVNTDYENGTGYAGDMINTLGLFWTGIAHLNGDYTKKEANALIDMVDRYYYHANYSGALKNGQEREYAKYAPTPRNDASYSSLAGAKEENPKSDPQLEGFLKSPVDPPEQKQDSPNIGNDPEPEEEHGTITLHITMSTDGEEGSEGVLVQPEEDSVTAPKAEKKEKDKNTFDELMAELDGLVGLENVKQDVHSLMNFIRVNKLRQERGMKVPTVSYHLVFTGNPGTGKTTVARLVAQLYYQMGILPEGQLVETDRSALVAGYLGQTAIKTQKVIQKAMGGVLFIDEAYSLANDEQDSYGKEAIETILKAMEDHRDELVVIVAGYTDLMHKFIDSNPGLSSRFNKYFEFPDYEGAELHMIFERFCSTNGYKLDETASDELKKRFTSMFEQRTENFGNARTVRNIFEKAINAQADRIAAKMDISDQDLEQLTMEDINEAMKGV